MNVSIYEVAKKANVSTATVSRVINKLGNVSKKKEVAVKEAIESLNYVPNEMAKRFATKKTCTLGLVVSFQDMGGSYILEFIKGVVKYLDDTPYSLLLINGDTEYISYIHGKKIDGLLLAKRPAMYQEKELQKIIETGFPVAYSGDPLVRGDLPLFSVFYNREQYLMEAMECFYEKRHENILMLAFNEKVNRDIFSSARTGFYKKHGKKMNVYSYVVPLENSDYLSKNDFVKIKKYMYEKKCSGIFLLSTGMTMDFKRFLSELELPEKDSLSFMTISWDDHDEFDQIKISVVDLGFCLAKMLVKHLSGEAEESKSIELNYKMFKTGTVKELISFHIEK